ncbi:MAG: hypothetical protein GQ477_06065 [Nanohaloarchaea archaeon]|nr:hypothetical protein [Candidatus Nanohaloarchaea archaeon]
MNVRKNMFVFCILSVLLSFSGSVSAVDFNITTFQNITDNCDYDSVTRTYNCSVDSNGDVWDNINITNDISLPQDSGNSRNIIFEAKNNFTSKTISAIGGGNTLTAGHSGGRISIIAFNIIIFGSINTYGTSCCPSGCCSDSSCGSGGAGNTILLNSENQINITGVLNSNGGTTGYCSNGGGSGGSGGLINISADNFYSGSTITSSGANGKRGGSGGKIIVSIKDMFIGTDINVYGGNGGYYHGGSGGNVIINSDYLIIGLIRAYGGNADKYSGGSGGSLIINSKNINSIGSFIAYGGLSGRYSSGVKGGSINIISEDSFVLSAINVNGGPGGGRNDGDGYPGGLGGSVIVKATQNLVVSNDISANGGTGGPGDDGGNGAVGGSAGKIYLTAKDLSIDAVVSTVGGTGGSGQKDGAWDYVRQGSGGSGGEIRLVSDNLLTNSYSIYANGGAGRTGSHNMQGGAGGSAGKISIYSSYAQINAPVYAVGGAGAYGYTGWNTEYCRCGNGGSGGKIMLFLDDTNPITSFSFDVSGGSHASGDCQGTCGVTGPVGIKAKNDRTVSTGFRLTSNIKELSTNNHFTGSTQIRIIDPAIGTHVYTTNTYNVWFGETDIDDGQVNSLFGDKPLMVMLARKYYLEITTSDDLFFSKANCDLGIADCDTHFVEFRQYYE